MWFRYRRRKGRHSALHFGFANWRDRTAARRCWWEPPHPVRRHSRSFSQRSIGNGVSKWHCWTWGTNPARGDHKKWSSCCGEICSWRETDTSWYRWRRICCRIRQRHTTAPCTNLMTHSGWTIRIAKKQMVRIESANTEKHFAFDEANQAINLSIYRPTDQWINIRSVDLLGRLHFGCVFSILLEQMLTDRSHNRNWICPRSRISKTKKRIWNNK